MDSRLRGNDDYLYATAREVGEFVEAHRVRTLNVAGPRESRCPAIHARAYALLRTVFADLERGRGLILREEGTS